MTEKDSSKNSINRRTLLKSLMGVPVLGLFAFGFMRRNSVTRNKRINFEKQLGLQGKIRHSGITLK